MIKDDEKRIGSHSVSVLQGKRKVCYVSGQKTDLQKHHIFHGEGRREVSDRHGFWVYLQAKYHSAALGGLHAYPNSGLDLQLKRLCQREYEKVYGAEAFFEIFHEDFIPFKEYAAVDMQKDMWEDIALCNWVRDFKGKNKEIYTADEYWNKMHKRGIKKPLNGCYLCEYESQFGEVEECIHTKPNWETIKTTEEIKGGKIWKNQKPENVRFSTVTADRAMCAVLIVVSIKDARIAARIDQRSVVV